MVIELASDAWKAKIPVHLLTRLDWARYDNGTLVWSWSCLCGVGGSAQNEHIGSALWHHLAGKS